MQYRTRSRTQSWTRDAAFSPIAEHPVQVVRQGPICIGLALLLLIPLLVSLTASEAIVPKSHGVRSGDSNWVPTVSTDRITTTTTGMNVDTTTTDRVVVAVVDASGQWIVEETTTNGKLDPISGHLLKTEVTAPWLAARRILEEQTGLTTTPHDAPSSTSHILANMNLGAGSVPPMKEATTDWTFLGRYRNAAELTVHGDYTYTYLVQHAVPMAGADATAGTADFASTLRVGRQPAYSRLKVLDRKSLRQRLVEFGDFDEFAATMGLAMVHAE